ncbi:MAG: arylamine N-acetyltransferase [candidate division KSB1 bacterium]|nr:arylamine N-acetyltransferase [candidate division KSB1 bacterium]MDZ7300508.1 arylamine N-acetyltransferase [candidate division KSB1 bacterium]MDZ7309647.1 arylamine N-acetyltransferase [candidate division KSB1 bacterium]
MTSPSLIVMVPPDHLLDATLHQEAVRLFRRHYGIAAEPRPGMTVLREILAGFSHLPYENLSKILKFQRHGENQAQRLRLPEEVMEDHLHWRLGGTCFSLTFFLQTLLRHHGFPCYVVMGDMRAGRNIHCALIVCLDGDKFLIDPGYLLRQPMALDPGKPRLYHTEFTGVELRFDRQNGAYDLFTFNRQEMKWRYRFVDRPTPAEEFLQHWQASFYRNSMHGLCLTRANVDELIFIHKDFMRITSLEGKRNVSIKRNYHETIHQLFGIAPEYVEQALAALQENLARERRTIDLSGNAQLHHCRQDMMQS